MLKVAPPGNRAGKSKLSIEVSQSLSSRPREHGDRAEGSVEAWGGWAGENSEFRPNPRVQNSEQILGSISDIPDI